MSMTVSFGLAKDSTGQLDDEGRAEICRRFVAMGFTTELREVISGRVLHVRGSRGAVSSEWLPPRLGNKYVKKWEELSFFSGPASWFVELWLTADVYVETRRRLSEERLVLPGTDLHGLCVSAGGDRALARFWELNRTPPTGDGEDTSMRAFMKALAPFFGYQRAYRFAVRIR